MRNPAVLVIHHRKEDLEGFDVGAVIPIGSEIIKTLERADSKRAWSVYRVSTFLRRNVVCARMRDGFVMVWMMVSMVSSVGIQRSFDQCDWSFWTVQIIDG